MTALLAAQLPVVDTSSVISVLSWIIGVMGAVIIFLAGVIWRLYSRNIVLSDDNKSLALEAVKASVEVGLALQESRTASASTREAVELAMGELRQTTTAIISEFRQMLREALTMRRRSQ
jgi:uncharacterized membrane protein